MEYNVHVLARTYVKGFYKFTTEHTTIKSSQEAYNLLMYSVKKLYGLESIEYSASIEKYGSSCIKYLGKLKGTVKKPKNVDRGMASAIVDLCGAYAVTMDLLIAKHINNGRIKRVTPYKAEEDEEMTNAIRVRDFVNLTPKGVIEVVDREMDLVVAIRGLEGMELVQDAGYDDIADILNRDIVRIEISRSSVILVIEK